MSARSPLTAVLVLAFAICAPGLRPLVAQEFLQELAAQDVMPSIIGPAVQPSPIVDSEPAGELFDVPGDPVWRVRVGVLFLDRSNPPAWRVRDYLPFSPDINAADLNFPAAASTDVSLVREGAWADIDFRYFGVSQATAGTEPLRGSYSMWRLSSWFPDVVISYEKNVSLTSWLQSAELNLRRDVSENVALLVGFRYLQFREQWLERQYFEPVLSGDDMIGRNELFGIQVGSQALLLSFRRLRLEGALKAGVFGNAGSSSTSHFFSWSDGTTFSNEIDARRGSVAFVGDLNFSATLALAKHVSLRGGYQMLWLAGVATATDQLSQFDKSWDELATTTDGSVFFHGAMVGLECAW